MTPWVSGLFTLPCPMDSRTRHLGHMETHWALTFTGVGPNELLSGTQVIVELLAKLGCAAVTLQAVVAAAEVWRYDGVGAAAGEPVDLTCCQVV